MLSLFFFLFSFLVSVQYCRILSGYPFLIVLPIANRHSGWRGDRVTPFFINSHTRVGVCIFRKGCHPVTPSPLPSMFLLAFISSLSLSRTNHPRSFPWFTLLLWKPACCSTMPKRLILIAYPASRKISALRVSLFCKYGKLYRQTTIVHAADSAAQRQWTFVRGWVQSVAYIATD